MPETREQIIERMRNAIHDAACGDRCEPAAMGLAQAQAERALPVAVKAVTDRVRALHWHDTREGRDDCHFCRRPWPCADARLLDQIDAELGGE